MLATSYKPRGTMVCNLPTPHISKLIPTDPVAAKMLDGVEKTAQC
jgi:hypothetical protein